ncbi:uncharacterized protein SPAPADRAFT_141671 [Spathaspora passalidarum NRRL Y-27907]|uniref:PhoD-like phosphatase domain-containing protein n=1 Tax=Spathaspora passalidarum (strain NRRL Y-27907 / 11-Y1) TaxID=619300 RepID=G3ASQ8_SPAPN|nr:uncharacterized protein SPAPADRAFT_141671 [Spathaspora passalidarum NRRL Y-27907]EGW31122.1 hypothetical protein SPAPADRAFT_141671 [Spathaspora passalidarum NRRL Y-27907]
MPVSTGDDWFEPIPVDDYQTINQRSGENVPEKRPIDPEDKLDEFEVTCGPMINLLGTHENNQPNYRATLALVVKNAPENQAPPITYKVGPASEEFKSTGKFQHGEFPSTKYYERDGYSFFRYSIDLTMVEYEQKVQYVINNHYKKSFQFYIPAIEESMNVISFSCNGFSLAAPANEFKSSLWFDILKKHADQHYHVMLGGGDQIYCDSIKLESEALKSWTEIRNPLKKNSFEVTEETTNEFENYYLSHYMDWFGKGFWQGKKARTLQSLFPLAMSQIPQVNIFDDHDIIDGFGSYSDHTMKSPIFQAIGNTAYKYYMIFQHHINPEEKLHESDPSWILGTQRGPYISQKNHSNYIRLGKEIALLGVDCRTERKLKQVVSPSSYKKIFERLTKEVKAAGTDIKHVLVMLGVPIFYPRLVWLEWLLTSTVMKPLRHLAEKGVLNKGLVNEFDGDVEVLDDLNDHWCSKHHKAERNQLIYDLTEFGAKNAIRITILSGDVHLCCIGRMKSKFHHHPNAHLLIGEDIEELNDDVTDFPEKDPRLMFNVISSAVTNEPPPDAMANLLNKRSRIHRYNRDTDEDIVPIFITEPDGSKRANKQFLNRRNWSDLVLAKQSKYKDLVVDDPEQVLRRFPQPVFEKEPSHDYLKGEEPNERNVKYPLYSDSLVTTLRVERDSNDYQSSTTSYELFIPKLFGNYKLEDAPVKHLHHH